MRETKTLGVRDFFGRGPDDRLLSESVVLGLAAVLAVVLLVAGHPFWALLLIAVVAAALIIARDRSAAAAEPLEAGAPATADAEHHLDDVIAVLGALEMPVLAISSDERVIFQNTAADEIFGAIPQSNIYLSGRVRAPRILDMVRETMATGIASQIEHSERLPSEAVYIVRVAPARLPGALDGERTLYVLSYRDVSQARRIDRMRSDFVANASHELRTPLASLKGFIETLQGPAKNDPKAHDKFLGIMNEQVTRMSRLVDDLLSLSRLELKAHIAPDTQIELAPLLGHVRDSLAPLAKDLGVTIGLDLPDAPVFVKGDADELTEVFENLMENACKYGQDGKRVEVRLGHDRQGAVEVSVRDYGPGIPAEHVPRITERFYRVNVEASRSKKGTGLGLAIVKHILTRHRARLLVQSELGKGTVFTVRF